MTEELTRPNLTFACELDAARLTSLFADGAVIEDLQALGARVMIMVSDFSAERAQVVRQLNQAGIPLVGIPLFPVEEGYYLTVDNAPRAAHRHQQWKQWTAVHPQPGRVRAERLPGPAPVLRLDICVHPTRDGGRRRLLRAALRGLLRTSVHPWRTVGVVAAAMWLLARCRQRLRRR